MTHDDAFLRDVLETPPDDAPRLIYADYLEDTGRPERGEFVRAQCELAAGGWEDGRVYDDPAWLRPYARSRELLLRHYGDWLTPPMRAGGDTWEVVLSPRWSYGVTPGVLFRRGFVESVMLSADAFLKHAAALFAAAPVLEVTLAGQEPWRRLQDPEYWGWYAGNYSPTMLPVVLWERLGTFRGWTNYFHTREGALAALSAACVAFGRERAALPPLPVEPAPVRVP